MADTDEEQFEAIKKWWDENGKSLLIGVVVALAAVVGYQGWQSNVKEKGEAASAIYEDMLEAIILDSPFETLDPEEASTGRFLANRLKEEYAGTSYSHLAALFMAKLAMDEGDLGAAEQELTWALDNGLDDSLVPMAKIRLARVKLEQDKPEEARTVLTDVETDAWRASLEEVRGDVHYAMGQFDLARESYQLALNAIGDGQERPFLQMKLDDLVPPKTIIPADEAAATDGAG